MPIPSRLHEDVEDVTVLIHGAPQVLLATLDRYEHLVEMPGVSEPATSASQSARIFRTEPSTPLPDGLIGDFDTSAGQHVLHVSEAEREAMIEPHRVADDFRGKPVSAVAGHAVTLPAGGQVDNAVIRVHTLTEATGDDATTALDLLTAVEGPLVRVTADAAYDTVAVYETAGARGATVVIPPARTATVSGHGPRSPARDRTITLVKQLGRRQWKKASGYHRQGRVENTFFRYKSIIGDGLRARSPAGQGSEVVLGCEILNRMTALGRPVSYRIGR